MASQRGTLFQPTFAFPMVSVCVLVGAFLVYYFPITARQEASLNRRAFRSLAAVSDSLASRVANYVEVLEQRSKRGNGTAPADRQAASEFAVEPAVLNACRPLNDLKAQVVAGTARLELECGGWKGTLAIDRILPPYLRGTPAQLFDDVLLTDADGRVLYQSIATGSRITSIRSPAAPAASGSASGDQKGTGAAGPSAMTFASASQSSTLVSTVIAGEEYRLYLVPVPLKLPSATTGSSQLIVTGLMRSSRFRASSMAVPGSALISAILLVLVAMAATWPLLKFATMTATDRIPRRSAVYLFLSTLATILLVSILAIHLRFTVNLGTIDAGLRRLAVRIESNLLGELKLALRVMDSIDTSAKLAGQIRASSGPDCAAVQSNENRIAITERQLLARPGLRLSDYPYFDRIFWADDRGYQHIKWEAGRPTSPTYVGDRDYFVETAANRLWQFADAPAGAARFRVDPILSRNTGEYRAVITRKAPPARVCAGVDLGIASMVTPLLSLIDPILPPDYGFAVVNVDGQVLFHSTGTKNGEERFLDEVEDSAALRSALFARQEKLLTARYLGFNHRIFVTPLTTLRDNPWSLIVFHNLSEGAGQHLERIVLFSVLTLIYFVVLAAVLMIVPATRGPREWMWPHENNRGSYVHLTVTLVLLAAPLYLLISATVRPATVLLIAAVIPAMTLAMGLLKVRPVHPALPIAAFSGLAGVLGGIAWTEPHSQVYLLALSAGILSLVALLSVRGVSEGFAALRWPSLTGSYSALWAATLALVAVLPCIAFFRVAYDYHGNLSTRRQQVQTMAALSEREERIKAQFGARELTLLPDDPSLDVAQWLFVRRRLEETLDRYDGVLLNPDSGQLFRQNTAARRLPAAPDDDCDDGLSRYVRALASLDPYGDAALTRTLTAPASARSVWTWCREGTNRLRVNGRTSVVAARAGELSLPPTRALLKSVTGDPIFLHDELISELPVLPAWWLPVPMLAVLLTGYLTFLWVKPTLRHMFLLDLPAVTPLPEIVLDANTNLSEHLILLTSESARVSAILRARRDVLVIDVAEIARGAEPDVEVSAHVVVLDRFDLRGDDADATGKTLALLERLAARRPDTPVVIVAAVDPERLAGAGVEPVGELSAEPSPDSHDLDRWASVLERFKRVRVAPGPRGSANRARSLWLSCTSDQRLALHQLAHDGWVNPKNARALQQLQQRGLITGRPLHFVDEELERFVLHAVTRRERKAWAEGHASAWDGIRLMFLVVTLGVVAAALFFSQQSVLGLVATGIGVLTPLTKLLSEANSFRSLLGFGKAAK